ncbi:uncharacterized protein SCHCODRAFT_02359693 [Schizophyllum commune H4-8]|uniref:uncharacterized protein n=1 Tax=Schizophyllum commune (strain H4-8 / FGSC 9210) TaxID=578458 RepID=UPI00215F6C86|nr:uncharacterized protein SCHCODRAFT_02359693 [Schizophyllum commune H4-8]KAI5889111.1 hypothetical protein SCHCODRAFT_02359693 [Schizophyllum commune H4-8]
MLHRSYQDHTAYHLTSIHDRSMHKQTIHVIQISPLPPEIDPSSSSSPIDPSLPVRAIVARFCFHLPSPRLFLAAESTMEVVSAQRHGACRTVEACCTPPMEKRQLLWSTSRAAHDAPVGMLSRGEGPWLSVANSGVPSGPIHLRLQYTGPLDWAAWFQDALRGVLGLCADPGLERSHRAGEVHVRRMSARSPE